MGFDLCCELSPIWRCCDDNIFLDIVLEGDKKQTCLTSKSPYRTTNSSRENSHSVFDTLVLHPVNMFFLRRYSKVSNWLIFPKKNNHDIFHKLFLNDLLSYHQRSHWKRRLFPTSISIPVISINYSDLYLTFRLAMATNS
jgi:hypothetical protein